MTPAHPIQPLLTFIDESPSPWHAVKAIEERLQPYRFESLDETAEWRLQPGGRYFTVRDDSSIILFVMGRKPLLDTGYKIVGAHTDSPGLRVKPNATNWKNGLVRINVEIYGSPILATFTDRDLSLAGRLCYKDRQNRIERCLIKFDQPLLRLPNLAIHMNRTVNEDGLKLHKQNELPLIFSAFAEEPIASGFFKEKLAAVSGLDAGQIMSWDLAVYDTQKGSVWGGNSEFYSSSRIDNLASCHAAIQALLDEAVLDNGNTLVCALFDHEEIGSESKHGAAGSFLTDVLQRIAAADNDRAKNSGGAQDYQRIIAKSFLISADMAHAYHPNFPNAYDDDHKVLVNRGPVIKVNTNMRYSSESISEAMFIDWCSQAGAPFQRYSHRCDLPCGSTIGPITSAKTGIRSIDIGNPMWAMHSIRESAGSYDHNHLINTLKIFFSG